MLVWYIILLVIIQHQPIECTCTDLKQFYVDCTMTRTFNEATQFCNSHQMTLLNLTNSSGTLTNDINILNQTLTSNNCTDYFWFSSGNQTGLVINPTSLDLLLDSLLTGILNTLLCIIPLFCPVTTTLPPITLANTVCTRSNYQIAMQKCPQPVTRVGLQTFRFVQQTIPVGLLNSFSSRSLTTCSGICSSNTECTGLSYRNSTCKLYM